MTQKTEQVKRVIKTVRKAAFGATILVAVLEFVQNRRNSNRHG